MAAKKSFTLLELLIVIAIISILSVIILPGFSNKYNAVKFDNFCFKTLDVFKFSQNKTIQEAKVVTVKINQEGLSVYLSDEKAGELLIPAIYEIDSEITSVDMFPTGEMRLYADSLVLDKAEIKLSSKFGIKKITLLAGAGNVSIEK
ncbi:MAG: prepilin-type N-terminal cleavage/methylation domain-containing protein [Candidatus Kaelpia aquatica]|nr:prepilin-type N-terminal cleavage/methylation domain-containing protein [Candidatus Kaelpia aquatica]